MPIGPEQCEGRIIWVPFTPNIHHTTIRKHSPQQSRTFMRDIKRTRPTVIPNTVQDRVEIAAQKSRNSRIYRVNTTNQKSVTIWITVRSIDRSDTENRTRRPNSTKTKRPSNSETTDQHSKTERCKTTTPRQ